MAVSKRLRFEILRRDNHQCRYCGGAAPDVELTVDHVVPTALGGSDEPSNLVAACRDCNGGKSSVPAGAPLVEDVAADAVRWARAMQQAIDEKAQATEERVDLMGWFNAIWCEWTNWRDEPFDTPDGAFQSIPTFISAGLTKADLRELVIVAMNSRATDKWRYFCGCCWKRIRKLQDRAREILTSEEQQDQSAATPLSTRWTLTEITEYESDAIDYALGLIGDERLDAIVQSHDRPACSHGSLGHCGDPVCIVEDAALLMATAQTMKAHLDRDNAVCAEAEALLDG
ncbi:HNH endonuclease [Mycobacterium asiaticum]|uniref:HNH endonuclease n=1 Tax=Mycobacterium asiaticum TaxID=1790 RepID=UPI0007EFB202|nr:HNH endonuclease [Mycobacterium asiaticum]OBJ62511.1 hypothetical protein A9W94_11860 [Mycobacterium asiaticum]